jgi:hypothetical protein
MVHVGEHDTDQSPNPGDISEAILEIHVQLDSCDSQENGADQSANFERSQSKTKV